MLIANDLGNNYQQWQRSVLAKYLLLLKVLMHPTKITPNYPSNWGMGCGSVSAFLRLSNLAQSSFRWRNWIIRGIFTWVMIFGFGFIIYLGPLALVLLVRIFMWISVEVRICKTCDSLSYKV